ncbi:MAG: tol-pal system protein YbgF [Rhodobacteraceae bacterium]|nr:tol-pal system protein YbgF [Paracoccaceae bacterium]
MRGFGGLILGVLIWAAPLAGPLAAQDRARTLADIRQELTVLYVEIQKLRRELSTTGGAAGVSGGGSILDRVNGIEAEMQRLTAQTEQLQYRIEQVVRDGTNRIGDLEFRLVELEGGDVGQLSQTTTLGGDATVQPPAPAVPPAATQGTQLAVGEEADFRAANDALAAGNHAEAASRFAAFSESYPGSPLEAEAALGRGRALEAMGDTREAARAYLLSYSTDPAGPAAPQAVLLLGTALGALGKSQEACLTLGEIATRYPGTAAVSEAAREMAELGCG